MLLPAFPDPLVAEVDQIGRIFFDPMVDPSRKLFQGLAIVPVGGTKVLDPEGSVLG